MKPTSEVIAMVNQVPDLDEFGKVHGTPWPENATIYDSLLGSGGDGIRQVVGMLRSVDNGTDYKPRYFLHGLVMHTGQRERGAQSKLLRETLCLELAEDYPSPIKGYVLRQLQLCGNDTSAAAIGVFLLDEENWEYAAQALQAIGDDACLAELRTALPRSKHSAKHLLTILQSLGWFRDAPMAPSVREFLSHDDQAVRLASAWALAMMTDALAVPGLLRLVDSSQGWARLQAIDCSLTLADKLEAAGNAPLTKKLRDHVKALEEETEPVT